MSFPYMQSFSTISNNLQVLNGSGGGNTFTSDYGTAGDWTQSSTGVDVDSTAAGLVHCFEGGGADRHVKQNIGFTASDTAWVMDIDFRWTSHVTSTKGTFPYGLSDGGGQYDAGHFAGLQFTNTLGRTEKKDDAGIGTADATFIYTTLVWEYERLRRNSSTQIENRCYSDSGRTTLETNGDAALTVSSGLTGLNTITHSVNDGESVSDKFVWDCDNASIWDGLTVPP